MVFIFLILIIIQTFFAQQEELIIEWSNYYGGTSVEIGTDIFQTNDGGFIVSGTSASNDIDVSNNYGHMDAWIFKLDSFENVLWERNLGNLSCDIINAVRPTS